MVQTRIVPSKPAMILEDREKNLIVSDFHIGFESSLAANEVFVGKNITVDETIQELSEIIDLEKPDSVILLGDIKNSIQNITKIEWDAVPKFFEQIKKKCNVVLIPGNHDAGIEKLVPDGVTLISSGGMVEDKTLLTHGHTVPSENFAYVDKIIMGHMHPVFVQEDSVLNGHRVWLSLKIDKQDIFPDQEGDLEITIVPAFNKYIAPTYKAGPAKSISSLIKKIKTVKSAIIVTLDGTIIGDENNLDSVLRRD